MESMLHKIVAFYSSRRNFYLILAGLSLIAVATVVYATRWGAGLSDDSMFYVKPARDILAGKQPFFSPHYPPLLPLVVTLLGFLGIEPLMGIRILNAVCFGINVFLIGLVIYRLTTSRGVALIGALLVLTSVVMVEVHSWAMSEALFITLTLATLLALDNYLDTRKLGWVIAAAILAGCAALTRYAGIALIASGTVFLLLVQGNTWPRRVLGAALFGLISGTMFAAYSIVYASAMHELNRFGGIRFVWLEINELREGFYNILLWLMPGRLARGHENLVLAGVLVLVALLIGLYALLRRQAFQSTWKAIRAQPLFLMLALLIAASLFMLYQAHISLIYRSPFDSRLLSPTHALLILLVTSLCGLLWRGNGYRIRWGLILLLAWILFLNVNRSVTLVDTLRQWGAGFASPYWHDLDAGDFLLSHQQDEVITTAPMGVYFSLNISTPGISLTPDQLRDHLRETDGYLVVFNSMPLDIYGYPTEEFLRGMTQVAEFSDCAVYQVLP
jgi:hypothetical protein